VSADLSCVAHVKREALCEGGKSVVGLTDEKLINIINIQQDRQKMFLAYAFRVNIFFVVGLLCVSYQLDAADNQILLLNAIIAENIEQVQRLAKIVPLDVSIGNSYSTPLIWAVRGGNSQIVDCFLEAGADAKIQMGQDFAVSGDVCMEVKNATTWNIACSMFVTPCLPLQNKRINIQEKLFLKGAGANPNEQVIVAFQPNQYTAMHILELIVITPKFRIEDKKRFINLFLKCGANVKEDTRGIFARVMTSLVKSPIPVTLYDRYPLIKEGYDQLEKEKEQKLKRFSSRKAQAITFCKDLKPQLPLEIIKDIITIADEFQQHDNLRKPLRKSLENPNHDMWQVD
jgi:hypothetical protein